MPTEERKRRCSNVRKGFLKMENIVQENSFFKGLDTKNVTGLGSVVSGIEIAPGLLYRARVVDGLGQIIHERLFAVEITENGPPQPAGAWSARQLYARRRAGRNAKHLSALSSCLRSIARMAGGAGAATISLGLDKIRDSCKLYLEPRRKRRGRI